MLKNLFSGPMNPKPFTLFSLVIFLFPLAISFIWKFYALSAVLIFVLIISYLYHSSENKNLEKLDVAGAWLLMFTNTILIVVGRFTFPYYRTLFLLHPKQKQIRSRLVACSFFPSHPFRSADLSDDLITYINLEFPDG